MEQVYKGCKLIHGSSALKEGIKPVTLLFPVIYKRRDRENAFIHIKCVCKMFRAINHILTCTIVRVTLPKTTLGLGVNRFVVSDSLPGFLLSNNSKLFYFSQSKDQ